MDLNSVVKQIKATGINRDHDQCLLIGEAVLHWGEVITYAGSYWATMDLQYIHRAASKYR